MIFTNDKAIYIQMADRHLQENIKMTTAFLVCANMR